MGTTQTAVIGSTGIADMLAERPEAARLLLAHRMHCAGCVIAPFETLEEACRAYGVALSQFLGELATLEQERTARP